MAFWLMKSEPYVYAWSQLLEERRARWDGVRNAQAANYLRAMTPGDEAFFYHSNEERAIVGIMKIVAKARPDPSDPTGRFVMVDVAPVRALARPVTLQEIRTDPALAGLALLRQPRLSVAPVAPEAWERILARAAQPLRATKRPAEAGLESYFPGVGERKRRRPATRRSS